MISLSSKLIIETQASKTLEKDSMFKVTVKTMQ